MNKWQSIQETLEHNWSQLFITVESFLVEIDKGIETLAKFQVLLTTSVFEINYSVLERDVPCFIICRLITAYLLL